MMQPRFERRSGNGPFTLVEQPRFRAGFDFLRLRADAGEVDAGLGQWWEEFSLADTAQRRGLMDLAREQAQARRTAGGGAADADEAATRKRRRRRRKSAGGGVEPASGPQSE
jgi:poly(A) polymerase